MPRYGSTRAAISLLALPLALGCEPTAARPPAERPAPSRPAKPTQPEQSRWIQTGGVTLIGPQLPQGTLVLLGGRRALIRPDGSVAPETIATPEPLRNIVLVPTASGDRVVAHDDRNVYRFDDPLGAPAAIARADPWAPIERVSAGPGFVAVFYPGPAPALIDIDTGTTKDLPPNGRPFRSSMSPSDPCAKGPRSSTASASASRPTAERRSAP